MDDIPDRCRSCVHWLGHVSKNDKDRRCNRNWGHEISLGHFWSDELKEETHGKPAYVEKNCQVLTFGLPLPQVDEYGNPIGPAPPLLWEDAFIPILEFDREHQTILFKTPYGSAQFNSNDIREYLMATDAQRQKIIDAAKARSSKRTQMQKQHAKHYEKNYGTKPKILSGRHALPPYQRGIERVPTGLAPLDIALKGGIPVGTRINVSGYPDAGKSSLVNRIEGAFVRYYADNVYAYYHEQGLDEESIQEILDNEKIGLIKPESFELNYMIRSMGLDNFMGLDANELFDRHCDILATNFAEESTQYVISALNADNTSLDEFRDGETYSYMLPNQYRLFTFDSIDAEELAEESFGKNMQENMIGDNHRIAGGARLLAEFFRKAYKAAKIPVTLLLVSQHRTANIQTRAKTSVHRGKAHPYFTTFEMNLYSPKMKPADVTKEVIVTFGKVHVDANIKEGDTLSLYLRPGHGFTKIDNCVPLAFDLGILDKSGSWVTYIDDEGETHRSQGTDPGKVADWLSELGLDEELYERTIAAAS